MATMATIVVRWLLTIGIPAGRYVLPDASPNIPTLRDALAYSIT
jgi:hypothetical protein